MNKKILTITAIAFIMGLTANYALSNVPVGFNVAVIDVQRVVSGSSQIKSLKVEQEVKNKELIKFVENARKDVAKAPNKSKKKALEDKYNTQLRAMKKSMDANYRKKVSEFDANITKVIKNAAEEKGYNIVLAKGAVLYGGTDITSEIEKAVK